MSVKLKAVEQAVKLLTASGADFCVVFDGQKWGELKPEKEVVKRRNFKEIYEETLSSLKPGEVASFTVERENASAFRSAITSYGSAKWGNGSYVSEVRPTTDGFSEIGILRVS